MKILPKEIIDEIIKDKKVRIRLACESHKLFFAVYLPHYITYPSAPLHEELFNITEDENIKNAVITAFRGSGKSTIMTLSYPLWAILGKQQKKFILILAHTMYQAKIYMKNIKEELETNDLLRADMGPFQEEDEWQAYSIVIPKYNARITCASYEQGIRGLRHRQYRPDLIVCDDIEDLESVRTQEGRDKTYKWLTGDVIPAGDRNTKMIIIGNLLHEDCLLMRLKENIEEEQLSGVYKEYPFMDEKDDVLWKNKFIDQEIIDAEKRKVGNEISWQREYMLKIIPDTDRVIHPEWIHYYDALPDIENEQNEYRYAVTAIDLAVKEKETADFTAMVSARVYKWGDEIEIYILPNPINKRLGLPETLEKAKQLSTSLGNGYATKLYIEDVGYQYSIVQQLQRELYPAEGIPVRGQDKRARLSLTTPPLQAGRIRFPRKGAEILIQQLIGFGVERHDDLADAFAMLIGEIMKENRMRAESWEDINIDKGTGTIMGNVLDKKF